MDKLLRKVKRLLRAGLPGADLDLEVTVPGYKVGGLVIWDGFEGVEPLDRVHRVWDVLDQGLTEDERHGVNVVLTVTPDEIAAARHG